MDQNEMAGRIMAHAFNDELEKIAGLPAALRKGGGGAWGAARRALAEAGPDAGDSIVKKLKGRMQNIADNRWVKNVARSGPGKPVSRAVGAARHSPDASLRGGRRAAATSDLDMPPSLAPKNRLTELRTKYYGPSAMEDIRQGKRPWSEGFQKKPMTRTPFGWKP